MSKYICATTFGIGHGQQDDQDDDHASCGPVNADFINKIEVFGSKHIHQRAHQHHGPKHEDRLILVRRKVLTPEGDGGQDQLAAGKVDAASDGPVADQGEPSRDPGRYRRILFRRQHRRPVVHAAGGRIDGADLGERSRYRQGDERHQNPAPEDRDGLAVGEGDVQCGAETEGHCHDGEGPGRRSVSSIIEEDWKRASLQA